MGADIWNLPESHDFQHSVVCIDYFSKSTETKPASDKNTTLIAELFYETIYVVTIA